MRNVTDLCSVTRRVILETHSLHHMHIFQQDLIIFIILQHKYVIQEINTTVPKQVFF